MVEPTKTDDTNSQPNSIFGFQVCPYCNNHTGYDYVHGHYQCKRCKQNVMPCCGGEAENYGEFGKSSSL